MQRFYFFLFLTVLLAGSVFAKDKEARLQVVHNAADPAAKMVDVYVNGAKLLDDFTFRTATPFIDVPAEVVLNIGVAPATSQSAADVIKTIPVTLEDGKSYIAFANGVVGTGFAANPDGRDIVFTLFATDKGREEGKSKDLVDFLVMHGATDAPTVDVIARDIATLVDDAAYGDITAYLQVKPGKYILDITPGNDNKTIVASFKADLRGLAGGAAAVFASGFLAPDQNNNGPAFGLFAVLADGTVIELPAIMPMARLQVVHNAADPAAKMVDVYVNGAKLLDDFTFRTATPFIDVPAEVVLNIGVAPATSQSAADVIKTIPVTLEDGKSYIAFANGVVGTNFAANPDGRDIAFTLFANPNAREEGKRKWRTDVFVFHGATDAPTVGVMGYGLRIKKLAYGDMTDYVSLKARRNWLYVYTENRKPVGLFKADLSDLGGQSAAVFASGFVDPSANNDGPAFGLFAVLSDGTVAELPMMNWRQHKSLIEDINADNGGSDIVLDLDESFGFAAPDRFELLQNYPNPFNPSTKIRYNLPEATVVSLKVFDISGREIANLVDGRQTAGVYEIDFDGLRLASGVYLYVLKTGSFSAIKRMTLLK